MCCSRIFNRKINSLHERCLRIIYQHKKLSFEQLLKKDNSVSIHHKNLQSIATEMYNMNNSLFPILIQELFMPNNEHTYNLSHLRQFKTTAVNTVNHDTKSVSLLETRFWEIYPIALKRLII